MELHKINNIFLLCTTPDHKRINLEDTTATMSSNMEFLKSRTIKTRDPGKFASIEIDLVFVCAPLETDDISSPPKGLVFFIFLSVVVFYFPYAFHDMCSYVCICYQYCLQHSIFYLFCFVLFFFTLSCLFTLKKKKIQNFKLKKYLILF